MQLFNLSLQLQNVIVVKQIIQGTRICNLFFKYFVNFRTRLVLSNLSIERFLDSQNN